METLIGMTLGHFRLTGLLGEGGMGEVYRGEDTKLGREVAVKVLPEAFVAEPQRLARFEREAKVLASLNHPKIAAIYEVGESVPSGGEAAGEVGSVHYLVMELAAGETLADRLARGPLPVEEAVAIALQIADALEEAHRLGIVHRDLKPANVVVSADGQIKVLDFGLARAMEPETISGPGELSHSPTLTFQATQAGVLLGTAGYMSPEQAAGKPVDARADVWAFGVVLFEMITGRRTFDGETLTHVIASVIKDEPDWDSSLGTVPIAVADVIRRCLRKDLRQRLQSVGEARVRLEEWAADPLAATTAVTGSASSEGVADAPRTAWLPWAIAGAAVVALGVSLLGPGGSSEAEPEAEVLRLALSLPEDTRLALGDQDDVVALSPDGRRQAIVVVDEDGRRVLALRDLDQAPMRLAETALGGLSSPFVSPDGEWVGFFKEGRLLKVRFEGGSSVMITIAEGTNRGATWGYDGFIYLSNHSAGPVRRVAEIGGELEDVTVLDVERSERTHRWPHAVPDGDTILFTSDTNATTEYYDDARIEAVRVSSGERAVLVENASRAAYLDGRLLFARGGVLYVADFDLDRLELTSDPRVALSGIATTESSGAAHFAVSRAGDLLYVPGVVAGGLTSLQWLSLQDRRVQPAIETPDRFVDASLSPDGRLAAVTIASAQTQDVWIADLERSTMSRFTFSGGGGGPVWSRDGATLYFYESPPGIGARGGELTRLPVDGLGTPERLWPGEVVHPLDLAPDGRRLLVSRVDPENDDDELRIVDVVDGGEPRLFHRSPGTDAGEWMGEIAPEGDLVAYMSDISGMPQVYVRPLDEGPGRWQVSTTGGFEPRWSNDGGHLYYRWGDAMFRVEVDRSRGFAVGRPEEIATGVAPSATAHTYSIAPDGERLFLLGSDTRFRVDRVHFVRDWVREIAESTDRQ